MSDLRKAAEEYIQMRRGLGFKLYEVGLLLDQFVDYAEKEGALYITQPLALRWSMQPKNCSPARWSMRLGVVRQFANYLSATDPRTEEISQELLPHHYRRKTPYIYNEKEILQLFNAAKQLSSETGLRAFTYSTLFGLLAVTGMRIGETVHLNRDDVNLLKGVITVRRTKGEVSRWIPVHPSTMHALREYTRHRDQLCLKPKTERFFLSEVGDRLTVNVVQWTFRKLSHQIGLRSPGDRYGPRIHDLRHTFAVRTLLNCYQTESNVEQLLPILTRYLGHNHVKDTYWYLTDTPELMAQAAKHMDSAKRERCDHEKKE